MSEILKKMKETHQLSQSEESIVSYVIDHLDEMEHLSSRELASKTFTSAPTVVRLVKKLGYANYADFKFHIGKALKNMSIDHFSIVSDEDLLTLIQKTAQMELMAIEKTKEMLSVSELMELIKVLNQTKYIDIVAYDTNAKLGDYAAHLLMQVGKIANVYENTDQQLHLSLNVSSDHAVFIFSKHARNKRLIRMAKILRQNHIPTIYIGGHQENLISKEAQFVFYTPFEKNSMKSEELIYYSSVKYIMDLIYHILLSKNYEKATQIGDLYNEIFF